MDLVEGTITAPQGFKAAGVAAGLKNNEQLDLALVVSSREAAAAGIFTKNIVKGHSLQRTMEVVKSGKARAVVINSGNANACVGAQGVAAAEKMAAAAANLLEIEPAQVLTGSTGVIGQALPVDLIQSGLQEAVSRLNSTAKGGHAAAKAIMTTDLKVKEAVVKFEIDGQIATLAGMAKGSGMIEPNMATMIALITTDLQVEPQLLKELLLEAANCSFNRVVVDGDTSVCDMVLALANGALGNKIISQRSHENAQVLLAALTKLSIKLAKMIAADGEGATKLLEINCRGAKTKQAAHQIAATIARSPLVKTAMFGEDANWGRILTAAGYAGVAFDPLFCDIYLGDLMVCRQGQALPFDEDEASQILRETNISISVDLGQGTCADTVWSCDFSYDYVKINGSYRS